MLEKGWNFAKEFSWPFGLCGGAYAISSRFLDAGQTINLLAALAVLTILIALLICVTGYVVRSGPPSEYPEIKVHQSRDVGRLLITKKSAALGVNMAAMIYYRDGSYERLIGAGTVSHVQMDGLTQLSIVYVAGVEAELRTKIAENVSDVLRQMFVRPGVNMQSVVPVEISEQ